MSFDPVRIGVIGTGRFGILHAKTLLGLAESELVALVDCSEKALAELPEEFSGIPKYSAPEDALRKSSAEAWVVSTSTADHVQVASMLSFSYLTANFGLSSLNAVQEEDLNMPPVTG